MKKKKNFSLWLLLFIFLTTFSLDSIEIKTSFFLPIKTIRIEGITNADKKAVEKKLSKFYGQSIIFVGSSQFKEISNDLKYINKIQIKKIYPDKIKIKIIEYKPIGVFVNKNKKILLLEGGGLIKNFDLNDFNNLPTVIGNEAQKKFHFFYKSLENANFNIDLVKQFNYFDINRWDIFLTNGKLIKLPKNHYQNSIKKFLSIQNKKDFSNFKVFDFRINGELILK